MNTYELDCTYGSNKTPDTLYVYEQSNGLKWYAVDGSQNVNATYENLEDEVGIEEVSDVDAFTWPKGVNSLEELEIAVES